MLRSLLPAVAGLCCALAGAAQAERLTDAPLVDSAWLSENLAVEGLLVVDIRDPADEATIHTDGFVPGAVEAPYAGYGWRAEVDGVPGMLPPTEEIAARIAALGAGDDTHVVIVSQGSDSTEFGKATRVYWTFKVLGHDAVSILDGGQNAWIAADGELAEAPAAAEPATFTAAFRPELLASTEQVAAAIADDTVLVDGRPAAQFAGESKSPVVLAAGTIPTAVNIQHTDLYDTDFAAADEVAKLRELVGLESDAPTITFCNTGHWASIAWFGLSEVGGNPNVAMYDGSMAEWTQDPSRPVE